MCGHRSSGLLRSVWLALTSAAHLPAGWLQEAIERAVLPAFRADSYKMVSAGGPAQLAISRHALPHPWHSLTLQPGIVHVPRVLRLFRDPGR